MIHVWMTPREGLCDAKLRDEFAQNDSSRLKVKDFEQ